VARTKAARADYRRQKPLRQRDDHRLHLRLGRQGGHPVRKHRLDHSNSVPAAGAARPRDRRDVIAKLTIKQLNKYLELPEGERDEWLDGGAELEKEAKPKSPSAPATSKAKTLPFTGGKDEAGSKTDADTEPGESEDDGGETAREETSALTLEASTELADQEEVAEQEPIEKLTAAWEKADVPTRKKCLASVLDDPDMLAFVQEKVNEEA
jgi:hypothetical protein